MRIAIDIDSTLHHYWDQLADAAKRRFGVDAALRASRSRGTITPPASPSSSRRASPRPTPTSAILAAEPYPGAVETVRAWHEAGPLHPHHHPPRRRGATRATARWLDADRPALRRALLLLRQGQPAAREIGIDVLIDDIAGEPPRARSSAGITAATLVHPWNRDLCEEEDVDLRRRLGRARRSALEPSLAAALTASSPAWRATRPLAPRRRPRDDLRDLPARDRARAPGHRLGPLGARRGPARPDASSTSSTTTGSAARSRGSRTCPADGGALLVSNHSGALPPDAAMIAKAIKEEHPRPRPLHLTVEHFFKGYPGFSMLRAEDRRRARPPGQRAPPALRRGAARARLPRGPQGHREALQGPLPAAPLRPRRLRRGGDARAARRSCPSPSSAPRRRCRSSPRSSALQRLTGLIYFPITPTFPHFGLLGMRRLPAGQVQDPLPAAGPDRRLGRRAVGGQGARADRRRRDPRARSRRSSYDMLGKRRSVWFG